MTTARAARRERACIATRGRRRWLTAFGSGTCAVPYFSITSCHFYDMDNEIEIWGTRTSISTPVRRRYDECANIYLTEAHGAEGMGSGGDSLRAGDLLLVVLLERREQQRQGRAWRGGFSAVVAQRGYWQDQIAGARSVDVFDLHAYPDRRTPRALPGAEAGLAVRIYRDYWDPTYVSRRERYQSEYDDDSFSRKRRFRFAFRACARL